jgi:hypothetical protein
VAIVPGSGPAVNSPPRTLKFAAKHRVKTQISTIRLVPTNETVIERLSAADTPAMSNSSPTKSLWLDDVPVIFQERRKGVATRRRVWRGGRRDSDWIDRPPDSWRHLQRRRFTGRWLSRLSIW